MGQPLATNYIRRVVLRSLGRSCGAAQAWGKEYFHGRDAKVDIPSFLWTPRTTSLNSSGRPRGLLGFMFRPPELEVVGSGGSFEPCLPGVLERSALAENRGPVLT